MGDIIEGKVKDFEYHLAMVEGKLKLSGMFDGPGVDVEMSVLLDPVLFLDKLKGLIPGEIDNAIIDGLKAALLSK